MREIPFAAERGTHTRTDPTYAPNAEVFDGLSHDEIFRNVQALDPSLLSAGAQSWQATATGLTDAVSQAHTEIRGAIADGWRGAASSTAAAAVAAFELHGQQLADVMAVVSQRLVRAAEAAEALRSAVGTPSNAQPDLAAALLDPTQATANIDTQKTVEGERLDVVRAMDTIYTTAFLGTGVDVPAFPETTPPIDTGTPSGTLGAVGSTEPETADPSSTVATRSAAATASPTSAIPTPATPPAASTPVSPAALPTSAVPTGSPVAGAGGTPTTATTAATSPAATTSANLAGATTTEPTSTRGTAVPPAGSVTTAGSSRPAADRERRREEHGGADTTDTPAARTGEADTGAGADTAKTTASASGTGTDMRAGTDMGAGGVSATGTGESAPGTRGPDRDGESAVGAGAGAGAVGGLLGGALAAGDTPRSGSSVPSSTARSERDRHDEDDELDWAEEDFVFDELDAEFGGGHDAGRGGHGFDDSGFGGAASGHGGQGHGYGGSEYGGSEYGDPGYGGSGFGDVAFEGGRAADELIGDLDPATPPVVGDWPENE